MHADDDNLIILDPIPGQEDCQSDYINACYVDVSVELGFRVRGAWLVASLLCRPFLLLVLVTSYRISEEEKERTIKENSEPASLSHVTVAQ